TRLRDSGSRSRPDLRGRPGPRPDAARGSTCHRPGRRRLPEGGARRGRLRARARAAAGPRPRAHPRDLRGRPARARGAQTVLEKRPLHPDREGKERRMSAEAPSAEKVVIPDILPALPLKDVVLFPYVIVPLSVSREKSIAAVDAALAEQRVLLLVAQKDSSVEEPKPEDHYTVGTAAAAMRMLKLPGGRDPPPRGGARGRESRLVPRRDARAPREGDAARRARGVDPAIRGDRSA